MSPKIHVGGSLKVGWEALKAYPGILIGGGLLTALILGVPYVAFLALSEVGTTTASVISALLVALMMGLGAWLANGWIYTLLGIIDGKPVSFGDIFTRTNAVLRLIGLIIAVGLIASWPFLLASLVMVAGAPVWLGVVLSVLGVIYLIPVLLMILAWSQAPYAIVDKDLSIFEALSYSRTITKGYRWDLVGFFVAIWIFSQLGVFVFIVGVFFTAIIARIAQVAVYRALSR